MIWSAASKVMRVGRTTVFLVGLAMILAVVFGVASSAFGANNDNFILGVLTNTATDTTRLSGKVSGGPALQVTNLKTDAGSKGLQLNVADNKPPLAVNATAGKATNLNSDKLDGLEASAFLKANQKAADAELLDGKDISELPGTVVQTVNIVGNISTAPTFGTLDFVGPTAEVTTSSAQRLVGVVSAPLTLDTGGPLTFNYGLCYRSADTTNPLILFYGGTNTARGTATTTPVSWTAAQTTVPGVADTWEVGFSAHRTLKTTL
jgi:hypothetical protein